MELREHEVYFDQYCKSCKHIKLSEDEEPCCNCLADAVNAYTHKPTKYEEGSSTGKVKNKCCKGD